MTSDTDPHRIPAIDARLIDLSIPDQPPDQNAFLIEDIGTQFRIVPSQGNSCGVRYWEKLGRSFEGILRESFGEHARLKPATLRRGQVHPRIWRNGQSVTPIDNNYRCKMLDRELQAARPRIVAFHRIQRQLLDVFDYVTPCKENEPTFGAAIQQLLSIASIEVETLLREAYRLNCPTKLERSSITDWHKLAGPMRLKEWRAKLEHFSDFGDLAPFDNWSESAAPKWWTANNKLKHDVSLSQSANLGAVVNAVCAVRILLEAQFGSGIHDILPDAGLSTLQIAYEPDWTVEEMYFHPLPGNEIAHVPALG